MQFIIEGAQSSDVKQGMLGDCWLISALSLIASEDDYIRGKFDPANLEKREITGEEELA